VAMPHNLFLPTDGVFRAVKGKGMHLETGITEQPDNTWIAVLDLSGTQIPPRLSCCLMTLRLSLLPHAVKPHIIPDPSSHPRPFQPQGRSTRPPSTLKRTLGMPSSQQALTPRNGTRKPTQNSSSKAFSIRRGFIDASMTPK
jgi:hypothetical protein